MLVLAIILLILGLLFGGLYLKSRSSIAFGASIIALLGSFLLVLREQKRPSTSKENKKALKILLIIGAAILGVFILAVGVIILLLRLPKNAGGSQTSLYPAPKDNSFYVPRKNSDFYIPRPRRWR